MKKIYNSLSLMCISLVALLSFTSCEPDMETGAYSFGISQYQSSSLGDLSKITNYLESKQCPMKPEIFVAKSLAEADQMAANLFNEHISKVSVADIQALGLAKGTSFTYSARRSVDPTDPKSESIIVASFKYPANSQE